MNCLQMTKTPARYIEARGKLAKCGAAGVKPM